MLSDFDIYHMEKVIKRGRVVRVVRRVVRRVVMTPMFAEITNPAGWRLDCNCFRSVFAGQPPGGEERER